MGAKVIVFLEFFAVLALIISPQVAVSRELAQTSITVKTPIAKIPFCNSKIYATCIPKPKTPSTPRKCDKYNKCRKPPAQPEP